MYDVKYGNNVFHIDNELSTSFNKYMHMLVWGYLLVNFDIPVLILI